MKVNKNILILLIIFWVYTLTSIYVFRIHPPYSGETVISMFLFTIGYILDWILLVFFNSYRIWRMKINEKLNNMYKDPKRIKYLTLVFLLISLFELKYTIYLILYFFFK